MTREEAINEVRTWAIPSKKGREVLETLIPELRENEDERIRKSLINFLIAIKIISETGRTSWAVRKDDAERCKSFLDYLERQKEQKQDEGDFTIYHPQKNGKGKYECIPFSFYGSLTSFTNDRDLMDFLNESFYDKEECERWCEMENEPELPEGKHKIVDEIAQDYVDGVKEYNPEPTWDLIHTAVCYGYHYRERKGHKQEPFSCGHENDKPLDNWKPSEEQMKALCSKLPVVKGRGDKVQDILETLYYDLKKLM